MNFTKNFKIRKNSTHDLDLDEFGVMTFPAHTTLSEVFNNSRIPYFILKLGGTLTIHKLCKFLFFFYKFIKFRFSIYTHQSCY